VIIYCGDPERSRRGDLGDLIFPLLAGHFDDKVEQVARTVVVVGASNKVGDVILFFAVQRVGDVKAEIVIF
jgi:hypothetical protein